MSGFKVDTKLFEELGELLVGKESTALVELIKNAYDADATSVLIHAENLDDPGQGFIVLRDNGHGMDQRAFESGFLTIAGRTKGSGDRRSPLLKRRYTGEKGVGRLAAHKLGRRLEIESRSAKTIGDSAKQMPPADSAIRAVIDWEKIAELETIDQIAGAASDPVIVRAEPSSGGENCGTKLTIAPIRKSWTSSLKSNFFAEAATLTPLSILFKSLPRGLVDKPLLFDAIPVRDANNVDPGFDIEFSGDLALPDGLTPSAIEAANWIAEVDYDGVTGILRMAIEPTAKTLSQFGDAQGFSVCRTLETSPAQPSFSARILQRTGEIWALQAQGIKVYMEGFRVPPYGSPTDDWLGLDRDYQIRGNRSLTLFDRIDDVDWPDGFPTEELTLQGNKAYLGAVFLKREETETMKMLVNREGFVSGPELDFVADQLKVATSLIVRLKFAAQTRRRTTKTGDTPNHDHKDFEDRSDVSETPAAFVVREKVDAARSSMSRIQALIADGDYQEAAAEAKRAQPDLEAIGEISEEYGRETMMWRVLASFGTELAAFVHEINSIGLAIGALSADLRDATNSKDQKQIGSLLREARIKASDLADRIKRNATYLTDATSFEGRRRRSPQVLTKAVDGALQFFESRIVGKQISFENTIDSEVKTSAMFPAELTGIFTNLISNAVKFTPKNGKIRARAKNSGNEVVVSIDNTGVPMNIEDAPKLFEAFQSTTEHPDAVLGQGLGMGLTITRSFIEEYGGRIAFVSPPNGFDVSVEFTLPGEQRQ